MKIFKFFHLNISSCYIIFIFILYHIYIKFIKNKNDFKIIKTLY